MHRLLIALLITIQLNACAPMVRDELKPSTGEYLAAAALVAALGLALLPPA